MANAPTITRQTRLENTTTRNAWYEVSLEDYGGTYRVLMRWGPLTSPDKALRERRSGVITLASANKFFEQKVREKTEFGDYKVVSGTVTGRLSSSPMSSFIQKIKKGNTSKDEDIPEESIFTKKAEDSEWEKLRKERRNGARWK